MSGGGPVEKLPEHNLPEEGEEEEQCLENPLDISTKLPEKTYIFHFCPFDWRRGRGSHDIAPLLTLTRGGQSF